MDGFNPKKRTDLETQLLKVRHMSRPAIYLGLPYFDSTPTFSNVYGLPLPS